MDARQVVYTNKASCRDCYRCLRACPVKAIKMEKGQAYVVPELCISCGTCIRECPQGAKQVRNDIDRAIRLVKGDAPVAASVAPSFVSVFTESERRRLASGLRKLGFSHVSETAVGAYHVAVETARLAALHPERSHVCTACPAVVSYVERYAPERVDLLVPVISPMLAHAKLIRARLGPDARVVFIGPCVAKKAEAERPENKGLVDCVLTFSELIEWFQREEVNLALCEESGFDEEPGGESRYFPLVGGSVRTAHMDTDILAPDVISASGFVEVCEMLECAGSDGRGHVIEPLFCAQGCVNGPAMPGTTNLYQRRQDVLEYAGGHQGVTPPDNGSFVDMSARFQPTPVQDASSISEETIREVLEKTGKSATENQLNCGACGYASCRDKAIAVIRGMAELEMCIPYMKHLAEQRTDRIIETSPNGIITLDERLNILSMNAAFRGLFLCSEAIIGRPISYLMDPDPFEKLMSGETDMFSGVIRHDKYSLVCHQILYALPEEQQYVGVFVDVTKNRAHKEKLDTLRVQTVTQAKELLEHQVRMAQTIAKFLGESSAQGESLLGKLVQLADDKSGEIEDGNEWLKGTYTSK